MSESANRFEIKSKRIAILVVGSIYLTLGLIVLFPEYAPALALAPLPAWTILIPIILGI